MRIFLLCVTCVIGATIHCSQAQWVIQDSHSTASLRGIHYIGDGTAWASGSSGTVLRTTDMGKTWIKCTVPDGADKLDFRGVQAFDANTAIVMSSGMGDLSRLYKTTDGCKTWKLVFSNPDKEGFFDALMFEQNVWKKGPEASPIRAKDGVLLGDPVNGSFAIFATKDGGDTWSALATTREHKPENALPKEAAFAASNSSVISPAFQGPFAFVTGGAGGSRLMLEKQRIVSDKRAYWYFDSVTLPLESGDGAGAFSVAGRYTPAPDYSVGFMIVGGDYTQPGKTAGNAVFVQQSLLHAQKTWIPQVPPHGYRSAVAYQADSKTWVTVGPNGTDISTYDGRNWRPLTPGPSDPPDADKNWNALSLPFVVGSKGRIGILRDDAITTSPKK